MGSFTQSSKMRVYNIIVLLALASLSLCQLGAIPVGEGCWKNTYGRGVGKAIHSCDKYGTNWEDDAALCYPKCREGFNGVGPICWSPDHNILHNYGRGVGKVLGCATHEQNDAGLCYPYCKGDEGLSGDATHYNAVGPICWGKCPSGWSGCGAACVKKPEECQSWMNDITKDIENVIVDALSHGSVITIIEAVAKLALDFELGLCDSFMAPGSVEGLRRSLMAVISD